LRAGKGLLIEKLKKENREIHMSLKTLEWNIEDGIGCLVLNQPPANAMTLLFFEELDALTKKIKNIRSLNGIIIRGQGRHFSSGADLKELTESINNTIESIPEKSMIPIPGFMQRNLENFKFFNDLRIPVIAVINGVCIGSAFELALFCHFRLCANNAIIGLPESTFGLMPGLGGIQKLVENTNKATALEMVFRGFAFKANEALDKGVVDSVFPKDRLPDAAQSLMNIAVSNYRRYNKKEYLHQLNRNLKSNEGN
jgi:enoyl-CoA hydratase